MQHDLCPDVGSVLYYIDPVSSKPFNLCTHRGGQRGTFSTHSVAQLQYDHGKGMRESRLPKWLAFVNVMKGYTPPLGDFVQTDAVCNVRLTLKIMQSLISWSNSLSEATGLIPDDSMSNTQRLPVL